MNKKFKSPFLVSLSSVFMGAIGIFFILILFFIPEARENYLTFLLSLSLGILLLTTSAGLILLKKWGLYLFLLLTPIAIFIVFIFFRNEIVAPHSTDYLTFYIAWSPIFLFLIALLVLIDIRLINIFKKIS